MGISFAYPDNWKLKEKTKDNTVTSITVAPVQASLASWFTHGVFLGHISPTKQMTLEQEFDALATNFHKTNGMTFSGAKRPTTVGGQPGFSTVYNAPSPFSAGERGYFILAKDKNDGYLWLLMFQPSNETPEAWQQAFLNMLQSVKFQ